ncbi:conserved membrane hypothetical protein [Planktothrix serta PCC 8927]|uniref:Uncharacterized protein n=1 Tax=Planktothrix serta PCC 8927 TaxID=671068 RepID=A0A7Z9C0F1_9CYAN|nr:hypothetical protein [Planktothrix serta]VXD24780.1 conserved membrane hypothetical protein [Planktothrix serta PCC 8927]
MTDKDNQDLQNVAEATGYAATGAAVGTGVAATVGGMGLVGGFGGVAVGAAPVVAAGAVVGTAAYGAKKALEAGDATALGAIAVGAVGGAGVSAVVGGMGLAVAGTAVGIGMAPVVAAGAVVGLAGYGIKKLVDDHLENLEQEQLGNAIANKLNENLETAKKAKLEVEQAARDEFWKQRDLADK